MPDDMEAISQLHISWSWVLSTRKRKVLRRVLGINVMYRIKNGDIRENKETECMEACGLNHFKIVSAYEKEIVCTSR